MTDHARGSGDKWRQTTRTGREFTKGKCRNRDFGDFGDEWDGVIFIESIANLYSIRNFE